MTDTKIINLRTFTDAKERREALENALNVLLPHAAQFTFDENDSAKKNIENLVGGTQIPLGIAGPLNIHGEQADGDFYIPLATTEGALVASVNRGSKAVSDSGGAIVYASQEGMSRGPVFYTGDLVKSKKLAQWIKTHADDFAQTATSTSSHLQFKNALVRMTADHVFVRFAFDTQDAMGMNMVTIATEKIIELIENETGISCLSVAGNFDIDKKPAWLNFLQNRGYAVWAQVQLKKDIVESIVKVSPEKLFDVWLGKCLLGSAMSGSLGFNAHFANIIAAMYIATGQDPAHVVEGSMGITTAKVLASGDLYFSVYLPAVIVGTVGGGTGLATQKEALQILGLTEPGSALKFAEIVGAAVLAGELSLLASLTEGTLGKAHKELGRGK